MLRTVVRFTPAFIPFFENRMENDHDLLNTKLKGAPKTGTERLKRMFSKNETDEYTSELRMVVQSGLCGAFCGACLGGFSKSRDAYLYFIETNQASIFKTTMEAKKKLQDHVTVAFAKGALHWGWRLGAFTGMFSLVATTMQVYRGETSITEYITAGAITGALYKSSLGPGAMLVGAGLGAVLSTIGGLAILGLLKLTGVSMDDIRRALNSIREAREEQLHQAMEKAATIKHDELTRHHDLMVSQKGEVKVEELKLP